MSTDKNLTPVWKSVLGGALLGVPSAMCGAVIPLSFSFSDSQFFMLFFIIPIWGLILGLIVSFKASTPSKKHPDRPWRKRILLGLAIIFALSFFIGILTVI